MPPPTLANRAMLEAPMPKVSMLAVIWAIRWLSGSAPKAMFNMKYHTVKSRRPKPTTVNPITEPAENATLSPLFRFRDAPWAVRQLAMVAVRMPINPDRPEKKPPVRNAKGVKKLKKPQNAITSRMTNTAAKNIPTPLY